MNDYLVASLNNPDFNNQDFREIADMNLDNTQMLSKKEYLKSDYIKNNDNFKNDKGEFSDRKFNDFFNNTLLKFKEFQEDYLREPSYDYFDVNKTDKIRDFSFKLERSINPLRQKIGILDVNYISQPTESLREVAQDNKVWNTEKQQFEDYTPNDISFFENPIGYFKSIVQDPLVLAVYEEDIKDEQGKIIHKKGSPKFNEYGQPYYETLNGRSPLDKQILPAFDYITSEDSHINKYDFFDSDDIEKNVSGIISSNVASILPLFTKKSNIYSAILIFRELSKTLPLLHEMFTGFQDKETPQWINNIVARADAITTSQSDYARENTFAFENFAKLASDVGLQYGLQQLVAQSINKLRGVNKYVDDAIDKAKALYDVEKTKKGAYAAGEGMDWKDSVLGKACLEKFVPKAEEAARKASALGRNLSLGYMVGISNTDVYKQVLEYGLSKTEAAAVTLGSMAGMFFIDKKLNLGELFFTDDVSLQAARKVVRNEIKQVLSKLSEIAKSNEPTKNKLAKLFTTSGNAIKKLTDNYMENLKNHTTGFFGKAIGEGLEEVGEELATDLSKSLYELSYSLGYTTTNDIGSWDNAFDRYAMSLLGGMVGGGIFYTRSALMGELGNVNDIPLETLIRNNKTHLLYEELDKLEKRGKLGNKRLSATRTEVDNNGERVYLTTDNANDSLNAVVGLLIRDKIKSIEVVLQNNRVNLTDEELFERMILSEVRFRRYQGISGITDYYQNFADVVHKLYKAEQEYRQASQTTDGTVNGNLMDDNTKLSLEQEELRKTNLTNLKEKLDNLRILKDNFLSGANSLDYSRLLAFLMDPMLYQSFINIDIPKLWKENFSDKNMDEKGEEFATFMKDILPKYMHNKLKTELPTAWERFKKVEKILAPYLELLSDPEYLNRVREVYEMYENGTLPERKILSENHRFEDEPEEFTNPNDIEAHRVRLNNELLDLDRQYLLDIYSISSHLDPITARMFSYQITELMHNYIESVASLHPNLAEIILKLKPDFSNAFELRQSIISKNKMTKLLSLEKLLRQFIDDYSYSIIDITDNNGNPILLSDEIITNTYGRLDTIFGPTMTVELLGEKLINEESNDIIGIFGINEDNEIIKRYLELDSDIDLFNNVLYELRQIPIFSAWQNLLGKHFYNQGPLILLILLLKGTLLDDNEIEDVEQTLYDLELQYHHEIDNPVILDETLLKKFETAKLVLNLIRTYIYAAGTVASDTNPVGHNKIFNEFYLKNKDKVANWEMLPEIDLSYATLFTLGIDAYINQLDMWIDLSNKNIINKRLLFKLTDKKFTQALLDTIQNNAKYFIVDIDDEKYNLLDGEPEITDDNAVNLFNKEKTIHKNLVKILNKTGISIEEFFDRTKLLDNIIDYSTIENQNVVKLNPEITASSFSSYDKLIYFSTIFSLNPVDFYTNLKLRVTNNKNKTDDKKVAPITVQEYSSKVAIAATKPLFKKIIKYALDKANSKLYPAVNTIVSSGVAGAGKTFAISTPFIETLDINDVIVLGPTEKLVDRLKESTSVPNGMTIKSFLEEIIGKDLLIEIDNDIKQNNPKYFTFLNANGIPIINLIKDKILFAKQSYANIIIDEATYVPTIYSLILDYYLEQVNGTLLYLGDYLQFGHVSKNGYVQNIAKLHMFAIRTPELDISLRDNNIQKDANNKKVRNLLLQIEDNYTDLSLSDYQKYISSLDPIIKTLNLQVYNEEDDVNGDLIINSVDEALINKLKKNSQDIGFITDSKDSPIAKYFDKIYSLETVQGDEFDYVVVDIDFAKDTNSRKFLKSLYTLMTRGRTAVIFVDKGLSNKIGKNTISKHKAQAPSIKDKINGISAVDELIEDKLNSLNKFNLTNDSETLNIVDNNLSDDKEQDNEADAIIGEHQENDSVSDNETGFTIPAFADRHYLSVTEPDEKTWLINSAGKAVLRNLEAIEKDGKSVSTFNKKQDWQKRLFKVTSFLVFDHKWNDVHYGTTDRLLPSDISNNFRKEDWENGEFGIEIRNVENEVVPLYESLNNADYSINIVYKVKNKQGKECIFDLGALNDIKTLSENKDAALKRMRKTNPDATEQDVNDGIILYEQLVNQWIDEFNKNGYFYRKIDKSILNFYKTTRFTKRINSEGKRAPSIRLGGWLDPDNPSKTDTNNAEIMNPDFVFSNVYTYASHQNILDKIDPNLKGKAVVFSSGDTTLDENELIRLYILLKNNPSINFPTVRIMILGNYGMMMSQLRDKNYFKNLGVDGKIVRTPTRNNFLGIEMFTSMWNFRAALLLLNTVLSKWMSDNNYDKQKLNVILDTALIIYDLNLNNPAYESKKIELLKSKGITQQDIDNLTNFNLEVCKNIPTVRLGKSKNNNGFYLSNYDLSNKLYPKTNGKATLANIDIEHIEKFIKILDSVIEAIIPNEGGTLNTTLLKRNKSEFEPTEFIDPENARHKRTLSNVIKFDPKEKVLKVVENGITTLYPQGSEWSMIPKLITTLINKVSYDSYNVGTDIYLQNAYIKILNDKGEDSLVSINVGEWYSKGIIGLQAITGKEDKTIYNLFDLMFHGTIEDVHKELKSGELLLQLTDARHKKGFFINPDINREKDASGDIKAVRDKNKLVIFYEINTPKHFFLLDVDMRQACIDIDVLKLISNSKEEKKEERKPEPQKTKEEEFINNINNTYGKKFKKLKSAANFYLKQQISIILDNLADISDVGVILSRKVYFDKDYVTFGDYFNIKDLSRLTIQDNKLILDGNQYLNNDGKFVEFDKNSEVDLLSVESLSNLEEADQNLNTELLQKVITLKNEITSVLSDLNKEAEFLTILNELVDDNNLSKIMTKLFKDKLSTFKLHTNENINEFIDWLNNEPDVITALTLINENIEQLLEGCK